MGVKINKSRCYKSAVNNTIGSYNNKPKQVRKRERRGDNNVTTTTREERESKRQNILFTMYYYYTFVSGSGVDADIGILLDNDLEGGIATTNT